MSSSLNATQLHDSTAKDGAKKPTRKSNDSATSTLSNQRFLNIRLLDDFDVFDVTKYDASTHLASARLDG